MILKVALSGTSTVVSGAVAVLRRHYPDVQASPEFPSVVHLGEVTVLVDVTTAAPGVVVGPLVEKTQYARSRPPTGPLPASLTIAQDARDGAQ